MVITPLQSGLQGVRSVSGGLASSQQVRSAVARKSFDIKSMDALICGSDSENLSVPTMFCIGAAKTIATIRKILNMGEVYQSGLKNQYRFTSRSRYGPSRVVEQTARFTRPAVQTPSLFVGVDAGRPKARCWRANEDCPIHA
ncbi:MAG: hypothetical protein JJ902_07275 [Roseibium sp.]|nr:hypothetical protein [Roseibium sp.]